MHGLKDDARQSQTVHVTVEFHKLKLPGCSSVSCKAKLRNLWSHTDVSGAQAGTYEVELEPHETAAYKMTIVQ